MTLNAKHPHLAAVSLLLCIALLSPLPTATQSAYRDTEASVGNIFQAGTWANPQSPFNIVLNEFLPNPDNGAGGLFLGDDNDSKPLGEWIELYNNSDEAIDLAGWFMSDASGGGGNTHAVIGPSNTNTGSTIIAAHGWLVVYMNKPTLNNTGEEIHLYTPGGIEVDSYAYDNPSDYCENEPTPGDTNATSSPSGTPGNPNQGADCSDNQVAENKSYARIPDGTGAWVDPIPTPGGPNVVEEMSEELLAEAHSAGPMEEFTVEVGEPVVVLGTTTASTTPEEFVVEVGEPVVEFGTTTPQEPDSAPVENVEEEGVSKEEEIGDTEILDVNEEDTMEQNQMNPSAPGGDMPTPGAPTPGGMPSGPAAPTPAPEAPPTPPAGQ
jgi:hypothetical protein